VLQTQIAETTATISLRQPADCDAVLFRPAAVCAREGYCGVAPCVSPQEKVSVAHIDCDLYQSTVEVLEGLHRGSCLQDGTILLFDDWNCNKANPNFDERRAFREFLENQNEFSVTPWFTYGWYGAAYILHAK
jgi:hypothetical protein